MYSRSFPLLSFHFLYITEASTFAGEKVLGSFSREITLRRMVLWGRGCKLSSPQTLGTQTGARKAGPQDAGCLGVPTVRRQVQLSPDILCGVPPL